MSNLDAWKAKSTFAHTLPSGTEVTLRLPDLADCIAAGDVPLVVIEKLTAKKNAKGATLSTEELAHSRRFRKEIIRAAVVAVGDQLVGLSIEDVDGLPVPDRDDIYQVAMRDGASPKAED